MADSRQINGIRKVAERERRRIRMIGLIKQGKLPYTPPVMSWLSQQLDKPSRLITQAEVNELVATDKGR
jgi:hypothetical protein